MSRADSDLLGELVALGLERREARWIIEEYTSRGGRERREAALAAAQRRFGGEPLQYVLGHWPFRTLDLDLDERVLIPRPETEQLVDVAIDELARIDVTAPLVLDLGCGSGAIGLAVVRELADRGVVASLVAVDSSDKALEVARANARKHAVTSVSFLQGDWYQALDPGLIGRFDLVTANPPYVSALELDQLDDELRFEPRAALVADDSPRAAGFGALETVIAEAPKWLGDRGVLVTEHGADQGNAARDAAREAGLEARTVHDLAGHERILVARR